MREIYIYMYISQLGKSVHLLSKHKSPWDAVHSGSQRSQPKFMEISMGRCGPTIATSIYFISCLVLFIAQKNGIILWKLHLCSHCLRLLWILNNFVEQRLWDAKFHHNYSSSSSKTRQVTCFRRYSGDTRRYPKHEKTNPSPPIPHIISKKTHLQSSKGQNPTQSNPPMELTQTQ